MSLWSKLDGDVTSELPVGFPRRPSALALAWVKSGTSACGEELLVAVGGDGKAAGQGGAAAAADSYNLDELCFGDGGEAGVDIWSRRLTAGHLASTATPSFSSHARATVQKSSWGFDAPRPGTGLAGAGKPPLPGGSDASWKAAASDGKEFQRTVLAFPPRPRCGFSMTPLDAQGRRQLVFGGRAGGGTRQGHCQRISGLGGSGTLARCLADVHILELDTWEQKKQTDADMTAAPSASQTGFGPAVELEDTDISDSESEAEGIFCADDYRATLAATRQIHQEQKQELQQSVRRPPQAGAAGAAALAASIARMAGRGGSPSSSSSSTPRPANTRSRSADSTSSASSAASVVEHNLLSPKPPLKPNAVTVDEQDSGDEAAVLGSRPASRCTSSGSAEWRATAAVWRTNRQPRPSSHPTAIAEDKPQVLCDEGKDTSSDTEMVPEPRVRSGPLGRTMGAAFRGTMAGFGGAAGGGRPLSQGAGAARWRLPVPVTAAEFHAPDIEDDPIRRCPPSRSGRSGTMLTDIVACGGASTATLPRPRAGHTAVLEKRAGDGANPSVLIYGGLDDAGMPLGDVHRVQIVESADHSLKAVWSCLDDGGVGQDPARPWEQRARPASRTCHTSIFCSSSGSLPPDSCASDTMVIFGGLGLGAEGEAKVHGDTWVLDVTATAALAGAVLSGATTSSVAWRRPMLTGGAPACRWGHGACVIAESSSSASTMLLCGGIDAAGAALSDCWVLDLSDMRWECVEESLTTPSSLIKPSLTGAPKLTSWSSLPTTSDSPMITPTTQPGTTRPDLGLCQAIWCATEEVAIVWGGQGMFKWSEPDAMRLQRTEREQRLYQREQEAAVEAAMADEQTADGKRMRKHKSKRRGKHDEDLTADDAIERAKPDRHENPASMIANLASPAPNDWNNPNRDLWLLKGNQEQLRDMNVHESPLQPKRLEMQQYPALGQPPAASGVKWSPMVGEQLSAKEVGEQPRWETSLPLPDVVAPSRRRHLPAGVDFRKGTQLAASEFAVPHPRGMSRISSEPAFHQAPPWLPSVSKPLDGPPSRFPEVISGASLVSPSTPTQLRRQLRSRDGWNSAASLHPLA